MFLRVIMAPSRDADDAAIVNVIENRLEFGNSPDIRILRSDCQSALKALNIGRWYGKGAPGGEPGARLRFLAHVMGDQMFCDKSCTGFCKVVGIKND